MSQFHTLRVAVINRQTKDTVAVGFEVPATIAETFRFMPGQYLTLRFMINGEDVRRSYSICSAPGELPITVAVKEIANGKVSTHINRDLKVGDTVDVMPPQGGFVLETSAVAKKYVGIAAGSGITPILSMIRAVAKNEPQSSFELVYANKDENNIIFKNELAALASDRIKTTYIYSRQSTGNALTEGRLDEHKIRQLVTQLQLADADSFYLCGPEELIFNAKKGIESVGVSGEKVKYELFTTPVKFVIESQAAPVASNFKGQAKVTVIYDDDEIEFSLHSDGDSILDTAIKNGIDAPFSCKGAVCCTCKAKVIEGSARMDANYALTDKEVEQGFILTCTSHPTSERVVINYDEA
jgi:ring-1,2-phenylacetyl-CoA epoxidase subunit PaaE